MSEVSEIKVEWTPQSSGRVSSIQIQSRIRGQYTGAEEGWTEQAAAHDPTAGSFTFSSNAPGTDVEVRARYRMTSGVYGAWLQDGIKTARVTIPYVDLTGTPSRLSDINPGEGGKLGGIAPGADVTRDNIAKDTSNVGGTPAATVRDNAGNAIAAIRDASGQPIKSADLIAKADADRAAAAAAVERAKSELTASVAATITTVATVRQEAAQVRTDLAPQITAARDAAAKASADLSDEIARAKGAEGTIWTTVTAAQKRADDAFTAVTTETTQRADGDRLLSQRLDKVETTATTDRGNLTSRITEEVATLVSRDDAIGRRIDSVVAQASTDRSDYNAKINSEATARASVDQALSNKVDVVEARLRGDQDSALSARIRDEATASVTRDAAIGNRLQIVEANYVTNTQADAKVSAEATARSNETSGLANRIGSVETRYSGAGNLVTNSDLISLDGWQITSQPAGTSFDRNGGGDYWNITGENSITIGESGIASTLCEIVSAPVAVKAGDYVQGYAFAASHRANNWVSIFFYKRDGSWNGYAGEFTSARYNNGGPDLGGWDQTGTKSVRVPDGTATMRLALRKYQTFSSEAGSIAWFIRPYLGFARQGQTEWNPYTPGSAKAVVNATNARIADEATASANRDSAISNRVATTESQISGGQDSWLAARIRDEATASNNRDNSISNRVATTEAQFRGDQDSGLKTLVRNNRRNLVDVGWWKKGAAIPWGLNGGQRNEIVEFPHGGNFDNLPMPDGSSGDAWLCQADGSGQGAGGWNSGIIAPLDPDKTYRFMIPIATLGSGTRTSYWGTSNVCDINTTNENGNPYFAYIGNLTPNKWHLFVGYLFPRNSAGKTHAGAGVWDMATGIKIADGWNYCFRPDGFQPSHRAYQFYATNGAYQAFGRPIIELVDGSEAPIFAALAASKSATNAQARISDEATASANRDNSLSNRISTTESQMSGGQDSWLAARIRDEATASANRDSSLSNRVTTTEANYTGVRNDLNNWNGDRYQDYLRVNGRVTDEATASATRDNALSNRVSTAESQMSGGQDSWLAARIRDEATASANRDASISNRTSVVEAQVSNDSGNMLRNGTFNAPNWVGRGGAAIPPGWGGWANDNGAFLGASPRDSRYGAPAPLQIDRGGINNGITQPIYNVAPGWYAFEVDVTGEDGNWSGSGVHVNFNNGYVFNFGFATNADTAGRFGDIGTANRQFTWLFYNGANTGNANLYLMSGWSGFQGGTNFGFFRSVWHRVVMRPATAGEIAARKVQDSNLVARVSTTESAISTLNGRAAAYWQVQAVAGNNRAQMTVRADANGGGSVDIVGDVNFAGNLNVGADSGGNRMKITNQNIQVFDGNGTRRVAFGLNF